MFECFRRERSSGSEEDIDLFHAARRGNEEAMAALYRRHGGLIYRFSLRISQDRSIAEEVTQDVFLVLLKQTDRFDPSRAALSTWLCGIARRLLWKQLEVRQRHLSLESEEWQETESLEDDPDIVLSRKEAVTAIRQGLEELPLAFREVIVLCELEEMRYEDVALVLGVPVGTVRSRLHRAKSRLAQLLQAVPVNAAREEKRR